MKLENISKIFGVLAFVSFVLIILILFGVMELGPANPATTGTVILFGMPVIFLLAAILTTLKRIARAVERDKKE